MKRIMSFLLLATLVAFGTSCGQKNKVNSSQLGTTNGVWNSGVSYPSTSAANAIANIISSNPCQQGQRKQTIVYNTRTNATLTSIASQWFTAGAITGGTPATSYVGINPVKDIMVVTKVVNGSQVVGFNIEVSFCSVAYYNGVLVTPLYFAERNITQFGTYGITLIENTGDVVGKLAGKTLGVLSSYSGACPTATNVTCNYQAEYLPTSFSY